jgi:hypothetical protein
LLLHQWAGRPLSRARALCPFSCSIPQHRTKKKKKEVLFVRSGGFCPVTSVTSSNHSNDSLTSTEHPYPQREQAACPVPETTRSRFFPWKPCGASHTVTASCRLRLAERSRVRGVQFQSTTTRRRASAARALGRVRTKEWKYPIDRAFDRRSSHT